MEIEYKQPNPAAQPIGDLEDHMITKKIPCSSQAVKFQFGEICFRHGSAIGLAKDQILWNLRDFLEVAKMKRLYDFVSTMDSHVTFIISDEDGLRVYCNMQELQNMVDITLEGYRDYDGERTRLLLGELKWISGDLKRSGSGRRGIREGRYKIISKSDRLTDYGDGVATKALDE